MATESVKSRILRALGEAALLQARRAIRSRTLKAALRFEAQTQSRGRLYLPHYWALYVHDGRGPVFPVKARFLVWFVDPKDDPRLAGGYPERLSKVRKLTKSQFEEGVRRNRAMAKGNPSGGEQQYMKIRRSSGPAAGSDFFEGGMLGFRQTATNIVHREMIKAFQEVSLRERDVLRLRL